jgi:hypothetical protein
VTRSRPGACTSRCVRKVSVEVDAIDRGRVHQHAKLLADVVILADLVYQELRDGYDTGPGAPDPGSAGWKTLTVIHFSNTLLLRGLASPKDDD